MILVHNYLHVTLTYTRKNFDLQAITKHVDSLNAEGKVILSALLENRSVFECITQEQTLEISELHQVTREAILGEQQKTRSILLQAFDETKSRNALGYSSKSQEEQFGEYVLGGLAFPTIKERYERVTKAHAKTIEWLFKDPLVKGRHWSSFTEWLQSGDGIYWINGKAGSGKSTLMRYIYDHSTTTQLLSSWSGSKTLEVVSFFFWNSGTAEQKSQQGLIQGLLNELLSRHLDLISVVFPEEWKRLKNQDLSNQALTEFKPTLYGLKKAFEILLSRTDLKTCLFIDGLDEYEGDRDGSYADITYFFLELAARSNVKICISSRPWPIFEEAFHSSPSLRVQDLTHDDIVLYINSKLNAHQEWINFEFVV